MSLRRGVIKVDLSRATEKLRENLLEEPLAYLCDLVRAATLSSATKVTIVSDSDDVFLGFDGDIFSPEVVENLFAHLWGSATARRERLFAIGVGAALCLGPSHVRVWSGAADEAIHFEQGLLAKGGAVPPRRVKAPRPLAAPRLDTLVHVRHGVGWRSLWSLAKGEERPEITLLRRRAARPRLELAIDGTKVVPRDDAALVRLPLETCEGEILLFPGQTPSVIEFRELGIDLVRVPLGEGSFLRDNSLRIAVPVVVVVDAVELPTNATRSRVAEGRVTEVTERALESLPTLFGKIRDRIPELYAASRRVDATPEELSHRRELAQTSEDALGLAACAVATAGTKAPDAVRFLLELPLLRDAVGSPMSLRTAHRSQPPVYVLFQPEGLAPAYAPLVRDVVHIRGRAAERILEVSSTLPYAEVSGMVELGVARRARLALHPSTQPEVIGSSEHVLRERIARHGIIADVALRLPSNERGWATLRIYVEGRVIETLSLTSDQFPMPLDAAFEAPALLPPLRDYSGVAREKLGEVFNVLLGTAMKLLRANGERLAKERPDWLFGYVCLAAGALGPSALDEIPCVPCLGKTLASLSQLRKGPVAWVPESISADRRAVDDRLVIHCSESQLSLMPNVVTFPYERFLGPRDDATLISALADIVARHRSEASPGAFAVRVELPHGRAYAALSNQSCLLRAHAGVIVDSVPHDSGPMAIVLDDDSMSLGAERVGVPLPSDRSSVRLAACALAAECLGVRAPSSRIPLVASSSTAPDPLVLPFLLAFLSSEGSAMSPEIRAGARNFPCFTALDHEGKPQRISIVELELAHSADIPFLTEVPGFRTLAWKPLVAPTDHERTVFSTLSGRMLRSGDGELAARYKQASAWAAKSELLQRPIIDFRSLLPNARPDAPVLRRDEPDSTRIALGLAATPSEGLRLQVLFRGRVFTETVLPEIPVQCTARVSINDETHLETGSKLSEKGQSYLHRILLETLTSYFEMALGESEAGLQDGSTLRLGLVVMSRGHRARIKEAVRGSRQPVATVQGPLVPLADLLKEATRYGTVAFPAWPSGRTRSALDEPTIHIGTDARGESLKALLFAVDVKLVDVSDELLDIVSRRSKGPSAAPTLPGIAPHAALRMSLTQLRVTRAEGEVELLRGPTSTISVDDGSGALKSLDQLGVSVRAAYPMNLAFRLEGRATRANIEEALREIHLAIGRRLRGFSEDLDGLPPYVRDHVRTLIRLTLAKGNKISKNLLKAQVFIDCDGKYHSMTEIAARTTPFSSVGPSSRGEGDCLVLTDLELDVFDEALGLRPELPATVPESIRAHALIVQSFSDVAGECALLPDGTSARTIITRRGRVVAELEPSTLWPVYARIEDKAGLSAEVHHKGLPEERAREYKSLIDSTIGAAFEARLGVQAGSICRVALVDGVQVAAQLSLGLEKHEVTVTLPGAANLPLVAQGELSSPKVMCPIPVTGRAYIGTSAEMVPSILSKVAAKAFVALLEGAPNEAEARAYAALLGLGLKAAPSAFANSVHARQISVAEVRRELGKNGFLWVSNAWTATEGRVVLDRSCPLVRALDRWAPFLICDVSQDPVRLEAKVASTKNRPSVEPASSVTPGRPLYAEPPMTIAPLPTLEEAAPRTEPLGWTERIMAFFGRSPSMSVPEDARIQRVLVETLLKHPLVNPPVLRYVAKGRSVRFDASSRSLQVRTDLAKQSEVVVVAAALAEINEVLDEVTDVEERRILLFLLSKIGRATPGGAPLKSRSRASSKAPRGSSSG